MSTDWEHRPAWICITYLDPKPKAVATGGLQVEDEFAQEVDQAQVDLYKEACRLNLSVQAPWIFLDGEELSRDNIQALAGISWPTLQERLRKYGITQIDGKDLEINLGPLREAREAQKQAKATREAIQAQEKQYRLNAIKHRPGRRPMTPKEREEANKRIKETRKAWRRANVKKATPEQKLAAREAAKERLRAIAKSRQKYTIIPGEITLGVPREYAYKCEPVTVEALAGLMGITVITAKAVLRKTRIEISGDPVEIIYKGGKNA